MATPDYKIEKGMQMPDISSGRRGQTKYKFLTKMEVGDSVALPLAYYEANRIRNSAAYYGRHHGKQFALRGVTGQKNQYRLWRIT